MVRLVVVLFVLCVCAYSGTCQNAEPKHLREFRNSPSAASADGSSAYGHRINGNLWDGVASAAAPSGSSRLQQRRREEEEQQQVEEDEAEEEEEEEEEEQLPRAPGNGGVLKPSGHGKSFDQLLLLGSSVDEEEFTGVKPYDSLVPSRPSENHHLPNDRRKKKRRRKQQQQQQQGQANWSSEHDNLINLGGRNRGKKKQHEQQISATATPDSYSGKKARSRWGKLREERRRRRRNRKRARSRLRMENRREEKKWGENPLGKLLKVLNEQKADEARMLSENPLNLSSSSYDQESEVVADHVKVYSPMNTSKTPQEQIRIPEPPLRAAALPGEIELSRHVEREFTQLGEEAAARADDDEEDEVEEELRPEVDQPKFDERFGQQDTKQSFDPERMLGYSRTDEDLPILDLENEVLQRTINDYNAYISGKNNKKDKELKQEQMTTTTTRASPTDEVVLFGDDDSEGEPRGDLSCVNGTFLPAPFVQHAVIKYVKSSRPGHEYLEADYECESGYAMSNSSRSEGAGRLVCRGRRWRGRLPVCVSREDEEDTPSCAELGCEQLCRIVADRAECLCREGFRKQGRSCLDIDECEENGGRGPCADTCHNLVGSYGCSCRPGRSLAADNRTCITIIPTDSRSSNSGASHHHQEGGEGNACSLNNAGCSHMCLASMGRVFCLCPDGFMLEDDWKTCQDVDECAVPDLQTEVCRWGCINTPGSYRCAPAPPFHQEPPTTITNSDCPLGYESSAPKTCVDINECDTNNGGCVEVCENTEGSFFCACEGDERILSADRKTCVVAEKRFEALDREATLSLRFREPVSEVSCSTLNPVGRGYLLCSDNLQSSTTTTSSAVDDDDDIDDEDELDDEDNSGGEEKERSPIRPGTKCHLQCPRGYELHGEYELTCRADGTWDGPKHGECLRYSKPRLDCPKDIVAELPPGRDEAFVTYDQPSTDLDWFRYVHSKPSWGTRLEANLRQGEHEITFFARHPVSKKQASCTLKITVEEGQAPKVQGCPSDIEITGRNGSAITWAEPVFTDNVKVTRVTSNESPGQTFSVGGHKVEYEAADEAGWTTKCIFTVVLRPVLD